MTRVVEKTVYRVKCKECRKVFRTSHSRKVFCDAKCAHRFHSREDQRRVRELARRVRGGK